MEFSLFEIENLEPPCILLESLPRGNRREKHKHSYYASLAGRSSFKIGRAAECDLRIDDISVSRVHSYLTIAGRNFFLHDNESKFGTLVQLLRPLSL